MVIKNHISGAAQRVTDSTQRIAAMRKDHPEWDRKPDPHPQRKSWRQTPRQPPKPDGDAAERDG